jgi:hypothetical protein
MRFVALVTHGLSAISVFGDLVGTRLLIASFISAILAAGGITAAFLGLFAHRAVPGWAAYTAGTLAIVLVLFMVMSAVFALLMLANRTNFTFVPLRDCSLFVAELADIYPHERVFCTESGTGIPIP